MVELLLYIVIPLGMAALFAWGVHRLFTTADEREETLTPKRHR